MKTHKAFITLVLLIFVSAVSFGQLTGIGDPKADEIGVDSAQQDLKEISINKFEDAGFWYSAMPRDQGLTELRRLPGGPFDKQPIPGEEEVGISEEDKYVLGLKVSYYRRGLNSFALFPVPPLTKVTSEFTTRFICSAWAVISWEALADSSALAAFC